MLATVVFLFVVVSFLAGWMIRWAFSRSEIEAAYRQGMTDALVINRDETGPAPLWGDWSR